MFLERTMYYVHVLLIILNMVFKETVVKGMPVRIYSTLNRLFEVMAKLIQPFFPKKL